MWGFSCKILTVSSDVKILCSLYFFFLNEHFQLVFYAKNMLYFIYYTFLYTHRHSCTLSVHADARNVHEDECVSRQTLKMEIFKYCAGILSGNLRL